MFPRWSGFVSLRVWEREWRNSIGPSAKTKGNIFLSVWPKKLPVHLCPHHKVWWDTLPRDLFTCLHIFDDFKYLRSFTDRIARMTGSTELNIWNPCDTIPFDIAVAEGTVQMGCFFVVNMIEEDGLIDRFPRKDWKDWKEDTFGPNLESVVGNNDNKENQDNWNEKAKEPFHNSNLYWMGLQSVK